MGLRSWLDRKSEQVSGESRWADERAQMVLLTPEGLRPPTGSA